MSKTICYNCHGSGFAEWSPTGEISVCGACSP